MANRGTLQSAQCRGSYCCGGVGIRSRNKAYTISKGLPSGRHGRMPQPEHRQTNIFSKAQRPAYATNGRRTNRVASNEDPASLENAGKRRRGREKKLEIPAVYDAYRLMERLHYRHMSDFLRDQTSAELTGLFAYLRVDDEVTSQRLAYAIVRAFNGDKQTSKKQVQEEEVF